MTQMFPQKVPGKYNCEKCDYHSHRSQDPFWKIRKIGQKNSFMKIDFQTSVKSDKKVCFAYIM